MHSLLFGSGPLFEVPSHKFEGLSQLPYYALLGLACGVLAVVINKGLFTIEDGFRRLPLRQFWWPAIGAVGFGCVGLLVPRALGVGYDQIGAVLNDKLAVGTLLALLLAKLVAWWIALGSGTSGGTLAPILLISGSFGALAGHLAQSLPGVHASPGAFALVAMAATFGAATRATFTAIVFLFELTRDYNIILPLMLAAVVADVVAGALLHESLMTEKLARRGLRVQADYHVEVLGTATVGEVMTTDVETLPVDATIGAARARFRRGAHSAYPLVDDTGRCAGIVSRNDLIAEELADDVPLVDVASRDVVTADPADHLLDALRRLLQEDVEHLPVVENDRLVGICTRTDIMRVRRRQFEHEVRQPGWRLPWSQRAGRRA